MVDTNLIYEPTSNPVARSLVGAGAYLMAPALDDQGTWFTWKSGLVAPVYTDCRVLARDPGATGITVTGLASAIRSYYPEVEYVVGMAEAGIIWSSLTAYALGKPHAFVRKQLKAHGTKRRVECSPLAGAAAVIVDDLMASGESVEQAYRAITDECHMTVLGVLTIVNWNFPHMRERFTRLGVPCHALVSFPQLLRAAFQAKRLSREAVLELGRFYRNPREHDWDFSALGKAASA